MSPLGVGDGKANQSNESGEFQIYLKPFPGPGQARQLSTKGGEEPRWSKDGRQLYFRKSSRLYMVDMTASDAEPRLLFETDRRFGDFDIAPDGQRFLMVMNDDLALQNPTRVIVNWQALIKKPANP